MGSEIVRLDTTMLIVMGVGMVGIERIECETDELEGELPREGFCASHTRGGHNTFHMLKRWRSKLWHKQVQLRMR